MNKSALLVWQQLFIKPQESIFAIQAFAVLVTNEVKIFPLIESEHNKPTTNICHPVLNDASHHWIFILGSRRWSLCEKCSNTDQKKHRSSTLFTQWMTVTPDYTNLSLQYEKQRIICCIWKWQWNLKIDIIVRALRSEYFNHFDQKVWYP